MKNKNGFTLIEMILTIALIVVLTTVFTASLTNYITKSRAAAGQVEEHVNKYDAAKAAVMALRGNGGAAVPPVVPVNFFVTFADWDGKVIITQSVASGSAATAPADPVRSGYIFSGWNPSVFSNITSSLAVTAQYATTPITGVSISGTAQVGSVLTASVIPSGATASYQWSRASTAGGTYSVISGATGNTYTLAAADLAKYIKVTAVGTGSYTGTVISGYIVIPCPLSGVTVTGTLTKKNKQTAAVTPSGATVTYKWQIANTAAGTYTNISGATSATYTLPNNNNYNGKYIRVVATGSGGYAGSAVTSTGRGPIAS